MKFLKSKKFNQIRHKYNVFRENLKKNQDYLAMKEMLLTIFLYGVLGSLSILAFTSTNLLIKFLGIGSLLWLFQERIYGWLVGLISAFQPVRR